MTETVTLCLLALAGLAGGLVVAGGVIALMVGLGVITRYAGITRTAVSVRLYEDAIFLGGMFGNLLTVYGFSCPLGQPALALLGLCSGIFVGGWIMALAEIVNIFLNTEFEGGGMHKRRVDKIAAIEEKYFK